MNELSPILEMPTQPCGIPLNEEDLKTIAELKALLIEKGEAACGVAAPQIGVPKKIFVMRDRRNQIRTIINPIIIRKSQEESNKPEGCLSVKDFFPRVKRSKSITISYIEAETGDVPKEETFENMDARIIQHEIDHLNGRLIVYHGFKNLEKQFQHKQAITRKRSKARAARKAKKHGR